MKNLIASAAVAMIAAPVLAGSSVNVGIDDSSAPWEGFMNVFELNMDGTAGGFVFASGWGVGDLVTNFDDGAGTMTVSPNTVGDPDPFWYQGGGGPGAPGNKFMEANTFQNVGDGSLSGTTVIFSGSVADFSFTDAHEVSVFIKDFSSDFSTVIESRQVIDSTGSFSISLDTLADAGRNVQWGVTVAGVNVWETDTGPFGNAVFNQIPAPGAAALLGLGGLIATRRRRA